MPKVDPATPLHVLSIDDLSAADVASILERAKALAEGERVMAPAVSPLLGLLFLEPSLRTRVGFAAAAHRLGWGSVEVLETRSSSLSMPERWQDTLRTMSGYVDVVVGRLPVELVEAEIAGLVRGPFINGGSRGPEAEHPTQALIDLFAITQLSGPVERARVGICGDPRMRSIRSLCKLLAQRPPECLAILGNDLPELPSGLASVVELRGPRDVGDLDVLMLAGMPHGWKEGDGRDDLRVDEHLLDQLEPGSVVLSPLPLIDEVTEPARAHPTFRAFEQSDLGLFVRMAILEHALVRR